jgi:hypothetical protein
MQKSNLLYLPIHSMSNINGRLELRERKRGLFRCAETSSDATLFLVDASVRAHPGT